MKSKLLSLSIIFTVLITSTQVFANGALALNGNQGSQYGFSYDYGSMSEAQNRALSECGSGCYIVKTFQRGCAAYAADQANGSTAYGWGTASNSSTAKSTALSYCKRQGGSSCIVRVWGCNSN